MRVTVRISVYSNMTIPNRRKVAQLGAQEIFAATPKLVEADTVSMAGNRGGDGL